MNLTELIKEGIPEEVIFAVAKELSWVNSEAQVKILEYSVRPWLSRIGTWGHRLLLEVIDSVGKGSAELVEVTWDNEGTWIFGMAINSLSVIIVKRFVELSQVLNS